MALSTTPVSTFRPNLLHTIPLLTSTTTLAISLFQYPLFATFLIARPSIAGRPLSTFWDASITTIPGIVVLFFTASTISGGLISRSFFRHAALIAASRSSASSISSAALRKAGKCFAYGAACAFAHSLFIPAVAGLISAMANEGKSLGEAESVIEERNRANQVRWLWVHTLRTLTVDASAVVCFLAGWESFLKEMGGGDIVRKVK